MKFSVVEKKEINKLILNEELRGVIFSVAIAMLFIGIIWIGIAFSSIVAGILSVAFVFAVVIYGYYDSTLYSHINYFTVIGNIEFDEIALKTEDTEYAYDNLKQIKFVIGFYQNYRKGRLQPLFDGISKVEFYHKEKYMSYEFILNSENEYIRFEKLLIKLGSKYAIQIVDAIRRDNLKILN